MRFLLLMVFISIFLSSCAEMFTQRTFIDQMDHQTDGWFSPGKDFAVVPGDKGKAHRNQADIMKRTPAGKYSKGQYLAKQSIKSELNDKENKLSSDQYREYRQNIDHFDNDSEKIYYLTLPLEDRWQYLKSRRRVLPNSRMKHSKRGYDTREDQVRDISTGMGKNDVVRVWGRPHRVEIAGNPSNQNERWVFVGKNSNKLIFFENGRVQGWSVE